VQGRRRPVEKAALKEAPLLRFFDVCAFFLFAPRLSPRFNAHTPTHGKSAAASAAPDVIFLSGPFHFLARKRGLAVFAHKRTSAWTD
jgi:hypothetical protein